MLLQDQAKLCVCDLTDALALPQPKISRHLALLRQYGLLQDNREGQWVFYRINPKLPDWAGPLLQQTAQAAAGERVFSDDRKRLEQALTKLNRPACR